MKLIIDDFLNLPTAQKWGIGIVLFAALIVVVNAVLMAT